ncbi:MAG: PrsW family intramembrane metalloprotease [Anaerolineae bacterium]
MEEALTLRRSIWTSTLISLIGLVVFVAVAALVPQPETQAGLIVLSTVLALIPSVIWLGFFYQQDRAEPEPKKLVVRVFIFGAVAAALVTFLSAYETSVIRQYPSLIVRFILTTFTVALVYEVLKIAVVRYVVLGTNEFDRITDGIVYGLAAGIGFATLLTVSEILRADGLVPLAGAIRAVDNALVHGALGAVGGFYIGRVKIDG